jgi:hypothetical protein
MGQKSWWLASAVLTIAAFGGGVGIGFLLWSKEHTSGPAAPRPEPGSAQAKPKPPTPPGALRLERLKDAEGMLEAAGQPVVLLKFAGNKYVKSWGDVETNGETRRIMEVTSRPIVQFAREVPHDTGDFVWLRLPTEIPGKEVWRMTLRGKDAASGANMEVYLFGRPRKVPIKSTRMLVPTPVRKIPESLPLDRAVCLMEVREISDQGDQMLLAWSTGLLGSAALPHPLATCALMVAPKTVDICTIRLMCKVEPENVVPEK